MIFCEVDSGLIKIIKKQAKGRLVVDCGAGDGLLGTFFKPGKILSLDFLAAQGKQLSPVFQADVTTFNFPCGCLPVFLRPCHSGFVEETILNNIEKISEFLYVSHRDNIPQDLNEYSDVYSITRLGEWEGKDNEYCYLINSKMKKETDKETWYLVKEKGFEYPNWLRKEYSDQHQTWIWRNNAGGFHFTSDHDIILETKTTSSYSDLDHTKSYLGYLTKNYKYGWLNREGKFYQASYEYHDDVAVYIIKKEVFELENSGWVRLSGDYYECFKRLSYEQKRWMLRHEWKFREEDID